MSAVPSVPAGARPGRPSHDAGVRVPRETARWVQAGGVPMYARCWVDGGVPAGPPVVMIHGLAVASRMCVPAARRLARRFRVYAPDLPGFGRSGKPDGVLDVPGQASALAAWMEAMGLRRAAAIGTSIGCQVAADLASRRGDLVSAVVLASPTVDRGRRRWRQQILRWLVEQRTQSRAMRALMVAGWAQAGIGRSLATFLHCMRDPVEDKLPQVRQPGLVLYGTRDPLLSRRWAADVAARLADGQLRVLPGVVHNMAHDNPLELARATTHFLSDSLARG